MSYLGRSPSASASASSSPSHANYGSGYGVPDQAHTGGQHPHSQHPHQHQHPHQMQQQQQASYRSPVHVWPSSSPNYSQHHQQQHHQQHLQHLTPAHQQNMHPHSAAMMRHHHQQQHPSAGGSMSPMSPMSPGGGGSYPTTTAHMSSPTWAASSPHPHHPPTPPASNPHQGEIRNGGHYGGSPSGYVPAPSPQPESGGWGGPPQVPAWGWKQQGVTGNAGGGGGAPTAVAAAAPGGGGGGGGGSSSPSSTSVTTSMAGGGGNPSPLMSLQRMVAADSPTLSPSPPQSPCPPLINGESSHPPAPPSYPPHLPIHPPPPHMPRTKANLRRARKVDALLETLAGPSLQPNPRPPPPPPPPIPPASVANNGGPAPQKEEAFQQPSPTSPPAGLPPSTIHPPSPEDSQACSSPSPIADKPRRKRKPDNPIQRLLPATITSDAATPTPLPPPPPPPVQPNEPHPEVTEQKAPQTLTEEVDPVPNMTEEKAPTELTEITPVTEVEEKEKDKECDSKKETGGVVVEDRFQAVESELEKMFQGIDVGQDDEGTPETDQLMREEDSPKEKKKRKSGKSSEEEVALALPVKKRRIGVEGALSPVAMSKKGKSVTPKKKGVGKPTKADKKKKKKKRKEEDDSMDEPVGTPAKPGTPWKGPFIRLDQSGLCQVVNALAKDEGGRRVDSVSSSGGVQASPMVPQPSSSFHHEIDARGKASRVGFASTLAAKYDAFTPDRSWLCIFCRRGSHADGLGDLFGPYFIAQEPGKEQPTKPAKSKLVAIGAPSTSSAPPPILPPVTPPPSPVPADGPKEVWIHESCAVWAPGVHLLGPRLVGLQEAVWDACAAVCSSCNQPGANVGCNRHKCKRHVHYGCALKEGWSLDEDYFQALCSAHKMRREEVCSR